MVLRVPEKDVEEAEEEHENSCDNPAPRQSQPSFQRRAFIERRLTLLIDIDFCVAHRIARLRRNSPALTRSFCVLGRINKFVRK